MAFHSFKDEKKISEKSGYDNMTLSAILKEEFFPRPRPQPHPQTTITPLVPELSVIVPSLSETQLRKQISLSSNKFQQKSYHGEYRSHQHGADLQLLGNPKDIRCNIGGNKLSFHERLPRVLEEDSTISSASVSVERQQIASRESTVPRREASGSLLNIPKLPQLNEVSEEEQSVQSSKCSSVMSSNLSSESSGTFRLGSSFYESDRSCTDQPLDKELLEKQEEQMNNIQFELKRLLSASEFSGASSKSSADSSTLLDEDDSKYFGATSSYDSVFQDNISTYSSTLPVAPTQSAADSQSFSTYHVELKNLSYHSREYMKRHGLLD